MSPPEVAGWNLALRFGLELSALAGIAAGAWALTSGGWRWVAVVVAPLAAATLWGTFNVLDDPSRSGEAPVEVPGWVRLGVELLVLGLGALGLAAAGRPGLGLALAVLTVIHYATSWRRVEWLLQA